jgi:hypothetical protein
MFVDMFLMRMEYLSYTSHIPTLLVL